MRKGFTLLELLVVLMIIGVMSTLVGIRVGAFGGMNLRTVSKNISASLRYARSQAAAEKVYYAALFDFDNNRFSITSGQGAFISEEGSGEDEEDYSGDDEISGTASKVYFLPEGIMFERAIWDEEEYDAGIFRVIFFPSGGSSGGDIIITNLKESQYLISVDFITGSVYLSDSLEG
ncbi:MAG: prepilin-type N-terminal cleavage/methylation domain-containing protein [Desulfobacterales bacterium]|nr:prepilin-type N-terminal cleavage/methylation domain-containing protein [Desulfobacterales bacterium]